MLTTLIAALSLATAKTDKWVEGWNIYSNDTECSMMADFDKGTIIAISKDWRDNGISVRIWDENWQSLAARDGQRVRIDLKLAGKLVDYDEWWDDSALIVADPAKKLYAVAAGWDGDKHGDDFWPAIALASSVEVRIDGIIVGRYSLSGSRAATLSTIECAAQGLRDDKSDPFRK